MENPEPGVCKMGELKLLFFASLAERLGCRERSVGFDERIDTVSKLVDSLCQQDVNWAALKEKNIKVAVNQSLADNNHILKEDDEVAFFPPVTGG